MAFDISAARLPAADLIQDVLLVTLQKPRAGEVREPQRLASFILGTCHPAKR
jgi:hypothetical protein